MDSSDASGRTLTLARAIVAAVQAVPGVADVSAGRFGEVATYGSREKVQGVVVKQGVDDLELEVHVTAEYARSLVFADLAALVRKTIRQAIEQSGTAASCRIDVVFDDILGEQDSS